MTIRPMTAAKVAEVLKQQMFGYLSLVQDGKPFVLTVYYTIGSDGNLIAHTADQSLAAMLRANPTVCFLVHNFVGPHHWQQVWLHGECFEVTNEAEREMLLAELFHALPYLTPEETRMKDGISQIVVYRIVVEQTKSEKEEW